MRGGGPVNVVPAWSTSLGYRDQRETRGLEIVVERECRVDATLAHHEERCRVHESWPTTAGDHGVECTIVQIAVHPRDIQQGLDRITKRRDRVNADPAPEEGVALYQNMRSRDQLRVEAPKRAHCVESAAVPPIGRYEESVERGRVHEDGGHPYIPFR